MEQTVNLSLETVTAGSVIRIASVEDATVAHRPQLTVTYTTNSAGA